MIKVKNHHSAAIIRVEKALDGKFEIIYLPAHYFEIFSHFTAINQRHYLFERPP